MDLTAGKPLAALLLATLAVSTAHAQLGDAIPHASYYAGVEAFYSGEYRTAARELGRETQRGIQTPQAKWVDSICYYAMYGEVLYHQGRNAESLAQFDQACQLLLAYPNWLLQVRFQSASGGLRPDANRARRIPPWGRSQRTFVIGQFPVSEQVLVGDLDAGRVAQQGGVVRMPMLWRVNVVEVVRMSALAIRRRNELLGPLAAHDPISKQLSSALSAGNLSPANHWSGAWIDLLRGLAQAGAGKLDEADLLLGRSLVVEGRYDHPLTGVALLEQGRIASIKGDTRRAAQLFAEAGYSAYYFEDWGVLTESVLCGWINHLASGGAGVYPPLEPVAAWAQTNRLYHVAFKLRLAQAESLIWLGDLTAGGAIIEETGRRIGEMRTGLPGIHLLFLQAVVQIVQGRVDAGGDVLTRALAAQSAASPRNFQILRTSAMFDARAASARVAIELYSALLADPSPPDWTHNPLEAMAAVGSAHDAAFDRYFLAALERKDPTLALETTERAKRRRYLAAQPFGARLLALRTILESPEDDLSPEGRTQRQQILAAFPEYRALAQAGQQMYVQLRGGPLLANNPTDAKPLAALYAQWEKNAAQRQQLLAQLAVRRLPSAMEFPPFRTTSELQKSLADGEAMVVFHAVGENVYGFLVTKSNIGSWQLPDIRRLRNGLTNFHHAIGNYGANRDLSIAELTSDAWRAVAKETFAGIFGDARLDVSKTKSLIVVPDNVLWYLPVEALIPSGVKAERTLADVMLIRYGPTAALAMSNPRPLRRSQHTGIVPGDMKFAGEPVERDKLLQELTSAVPGAQVLPEALPQPARLVSPLLDGMIALDDVSADIVGDASSLLARSRNTAKDKVSSWVSLPYGGPERVAIAGFKTEAFGARATRREPARAGTSRRAGAAPGDEVFQSLCNLMAGGARTVLLSRWRTSGRTNFDLVREYFKEPASVPATEAWQRACVLARENPLDQNREPRVKRSDELGDTPSADHPFLWAGYLLVDTGPRPETIDEPEPPDNKAPGNNDAKEKPLPAPARPAEGAGETFPPNDEKQSPAETPTDSTTDGTSAGKAGEQG